MTSPNSADIAYLIAREREEQLVADARRPDRLALVTRLRSAIRR